MGVNRKFDFRRVWKFYWDLSNAISGGKWLFKWDCVFSGGTLYPSTNYGYLSYKNQSIDSKSMDWFLYDNFRHE